MRYCRHYFFSCYIIFKSRENKESSQCSWCDKCVQHTSQRNISICNTEYGSILACSLHISSGGFLKIPLFSDSIDLSAVVLKYSFFLLCHNPLHTLPQFVYPFCCLWTLVSAFLQVQSYSEHSFT